MTILLVEDDVELAESLLERFRDSELHAVHRTDGESGLEAVRTGDYEVIVLDRMLPGLSGLEFVRLLRRESLATPVIYLVFDRAARRISAYFGWQTEIAPGPAE